MSKYNPLKEFLQLTPKHIQKVTVSFNQISKIINSTLPSSSAIHRQWWENQTTATGRPQNQAWNDAGFEVEAVDLQQEWVIFKKI